MPVQKSWSGPGEVLASFALYQSGLEYTVRNVLKFTKFLNYKYNEKIIPNLQYSEENIFKFAKYWLGFSVIHLKLQNYTEIS